MITRRLFPIILLSGAALLPLVASADVAEDVRFVRALRSRKLFRLAEYHCQLLLSKSALPISEEATLTIELLDTLREHAVVSDVAQREALWEQSQKAAQSFAQRHAASDWSLAVRVVGAKCLVAQGKVLREEAELTSFIEQERSRLEQAEADRLSSARLVLRGAVRELRDVAEKLGEALRRSQRVLTSDDFRLTEEELLALEKQIYFWLGVSALELSRTFNRNSDDCIGALNEAAAKLQVVSKLPLDHPLAFPARLYLAETYRLLDQKEEAKTLLNQFDEKSLDDTQRALLLAAWLSWATTFGEENVARKLFDQAAELKGPRAPELIYAMLEAACGFWKAAATKGQDESQAWEKRVKELVEALHHSGAPYWARRGEILVGKLVISSDTNVRSGLDIYVAENAYRSGRWREAVLAYDRAAKAAKEAGDLGQAFECAWMAASIFHQQKDHQQAWRRFENLSREYPQHARALEAAFWGLVNLGQLVADNPEQFLAAYESGLREFVQKFPESRESLHVRFRLAQLLEYQGRLREALDVYLAAIENASPSVSMHPAEPSRLPEKLPEDLAENRPSVGLEAIFAGLDRVCASLFAETRKNAAEEAREIAERLHRWATRYLTEKKDLRYAMMAEERAIRLLLWEANDPSSAEKILQALFPDRIRFDQAFQELAGDAQAQSRWTALWLEVMARQGRKIEAAQWCEQFRKSDFELRWAWAEQLATRLTGLPPQEMRTLAQWAVAGTWDFPEKYPTYPDAWKHNAGLLYARLLVLADYRDKAVGWLRQMAGEFTQNGEIHENLALLLAYSPDTSSRVEALQKFREIAQRTPEGSARWFRSQYMIAWLLHHLGRTQQAWEVLGVLEAVHPDLGGEPIRGKILALKEECQQQLRRGGVNH